MRFNTIPGYVDSYATGSQVICNPIPLDADEDHVVFTKRLWAAVRYLEDREYIAEGSMAEEECRGFVSMRKEKVNLILTQDLTFFSRFVHATDEARAQNLLEKKDRIALFQRFLYSKNSDETTDPTTS